MINSTECKYRKWEEDDYDVISGHSYYHPVCTHPNRKIHSSCPYDHCKDREPRIFKLSDFPIKEAQDKLRLMLFTRIKLQILDPENALDLDRKIINCYNGKEIDELGNMLEYN